MNRRGFLKLLAAIPVIRDIPMIPVMGSTGDTRFTSARKYDGGAGGCAGDGGGGGGAGGLCIVIQNMSAIPFSVTAQGGTGKIPVFGDGYDGDLVLADPPKGKVSYQIPLEELGEFNRSVNEGESLARWLKEG